MNPSPRSYDPVRNHDPVGAATPGLLALVCGACGSPLEVGEEAEVFPCRRCGRAYEPAGTGLQERVFLTAAVTSTFGHPEDARYIAVWRFAAQVVLREKRTAGLEVDDVWPAVRRTAAPHQAFLYVPSFTVARVAVQQLGIGLTVAQPRLQLAPGLPPERPQHRPKNVDDGAGGAVPPAVEFGTLSPVVFGDPDARAVAHFVYLALEAQRTPDLRYIDYDLLLGDGELLFLPAVYDRRHVRSANWRFMLAEFDGMVA